MQLMAGLLMWCPLHDISRDMPPTNPWLCLLQVTIACGNASSAAASAAKPLRLAVTGKAHPAVLTLEPRLLHFGRVACHEWADQLVHVTNASHQAVCLAVDKASPYYQVNGVLP
jgi:uncharacterized membrane protein